MGSYILKRKTFSGNEEEGKKKKGLSTGAKIALGTAATAGLTYAGYKGHLGSGIQKGIGNTMVNAGIGVGKIAGADSRVSEGLIRRGANAFGIGKATSKAMDTALKTGAEYTGGYDKYAASRFGAQQINKANRALGIQAEAIVRKPKPATTTK